MRNQISDGVSPRAVSIRTPLIAYILAIASLTAFLAGFAVVNVLPALVAAIAGSILSIWAIAIAPRWASGLLAGVFFAALFRNKGKVEGGVKFMMGIWLFFIAFFLLTGAAAVNNWHKGNIRPVVIRDEPLTQASGILEFSVGRYYVKFVNGSVLRLTCPFSVGAKSSEQRWCFNEAAVAARGHSISFRHGPPWRSVALYAHVYDARYGDRILVDPKLIRTARQDRMQRPLESAWGAMIMTVALLFFLLPFIPFKISISSSELGDGVQK